MGRIRDWWYGEQHRSDEPGPSDPSTVHSIPSREVSQRSVTSREAVGLSAVFRAVEIRATSLEQISYDARRAGQMLVERPLLLAKPDPDVSYGRFMKQTSLSLDLAGNCYWRIGRDPQGRASTAWVMNPHDVTIDASPSGRVTGYKYRGKSLSVDEVQHLIRLPLPGSPYGVGPIQLAQMELRGIIDTVEYASEVINTGDTPTGVLKSESVLTPETAKAAKEQWTESRGGKGGVAVLGQGLDYRQVYLSPKDAQFIESQQFNVTTVTRMFAVPASLMLISTEGASRTYQNVEQDWNGFVRFGLMDALTEIEDAFTDLLPRGTEARKNTAALLQGDTTTRYAAHESALRAGWRTVNEIRQIEGLPPIDGGDQIQPAAPAPAQEAADV